jgi:hypothetical protein
MRLALEMKRGRIGMRDAKDRDFPSRHSYQSQRFS